MHSAKVQEKKNHRRRRVSDLCLSRLYCLRLDHQEGGRAQEEEAEEGQRRKVPEQGQKVQPRKRLLLKMHSSPIQEQKGLSVPGAQERAQDQTAARRMSTVRVPRMSSQRSE